MWEYSLWCKDCHTEKIRLLCVRTLRETEIALKEVHHDFKLDNLKYLEQKYAERIENNE